LDADDLRNLLRSKGIPVNGSWGQTKPVSESLGDPDDPTAGSTADPDPDPDPGPEILRVVLRQKEALRAIEGILEGQLESDQKTLSELHATLARIKHGGGG